MPRVLLVIDEFQEFFVEDDKIAQEVTLLLDRLVRQGRAFGMHVFLGSQTLGGAYSLPQGHAGPDGRPDRPAMQRGRRPPDPQRGQHGRPAADPPRRGDLQRRQRHDGGEQPLPGRLAHRTSSRESYLERIQEMCQRAGHPQAAADRLRGQPAGRGEQEPAAATTCSRPPSGPSRPRPTRPGWATRSRSRTRRRWCSARRAAATS